MESDADEPHEGRLLLERRLEVTEDVVDVETDDEGGFTETNRHVSRILSSKQTKSSCASCC